MKKLFFIIAILSVSLSFSQAFTGSGDNKFQVGANFQDGGTGLFVSYDFGIGENISLGLSSNYVLGLDNNIDANFDHRFDLRARFNANLGNVINIDENFDIYPGLSVGLKNFGGHLGARYFFTDGFGIFTELNTPFAKYKTEDLTPQEELHNQFSLNIGAVFNL
ncbi:DUF6646 family protein [Siansivirga zeaxanthinifaciens]|uniref:Membrane protein n=1 Tax=Siansivirga zeaxanthinifaciens CC-SAMT-1 TaxID=1454006 RepID=A0A0C5WBP5_9FLAO|nr:DUF6646 family protein [Siansivirga zeaxanthinifaciens]AJR02749.1 membrane protein [Siansivirga zeaxanthinifaciens CC-SAMT-1]